MKKIGVLIALVCFLAACLTMVGCKGSISDEAKESLSGKWEINSIEAEDEEKATSAADISLMKQMGLSVTLDLNEDGTASMDVFGEVSEGEWKAGDASSATLTIDGQKINAELDKDGYLRLSQKGAVLVFQRPTADSPSTNDGSEVEKAKEEAESKAKEKAEDSDSSEKESDTDSEATSEESTVGEQQADSSATEESSYDDSSYTDAGYSDEGYVDSSADAGYSSDEGTATTG